MAQTHQLTAVIEREGTGFVALCPELDVASQGDTVEEARRFAIVYGTLPGHGEQGEEAFLINRHDDNAVTFDIVAFSRPVGVARLGAPAVRFLQRRVTDRYLAGLQRFVTGSA